MRNWWHRLWCGDCRLVTRVVQAATKDSGFLCMEPPISQLTIFMALMNCPDAISKMDALLVELIHRWKVSPINPLSTLPT